MSELLSRLRAYAAANPGDVKVIAATVDTLRRERQEADAEARRDRAKLPSVNTTKRGLRAPELDHEPFLLTRRVVRVCGVRVPVARKPEAFCPGW